MPTDRGVSLYRRRIRRLVRDLQDGKPMPQPQQVSGQAVRTYGQDSVMKMPADPGTNDRRFLKQLGRDVHEHAI